MKILLNLDLKLLRNCWIWLVRFELNYEHLSRIKFSDSNVFDDQNFRGIRKIGFFLNFCFMLSFFLCTVSSFSVAMRDMNLLSSCSFGSVLSLLVRIKNFDMKIYHGISFSVSPEWEASIFTSTIGWVWSPPSWMINFLLLRKTKKFLSGTIECSRKFYFPWFSSILGQRFYWFWGHGWTQRNMQCRYFLEFLEQSEELNLFYHRLFSAMRAQPQK